MIVNGDGSAPKRLTRGEPLARNLDSADGAGLLGDGGVVDGVLTVSVMVEHR